MVRSDKLHHRCYVLLGRFKKEGWYLHTMPVDNLFKTESVPPL